MEQLIYNQDIEFIKTLFFKTVQNIGGKNENRTSKKK